MSRIVVNKKRIVIKENVSKMYPALENLNVKPSGQQQVFNHPNSYGYDEVIVEEVASDTLNVIPTEKEQQITGLFGIVNIDEIPNEYKKVSVEDETLILSRVSVTGEELIV